MPRADTPPLENAEAQLTVAKSDLASELNPEHDSFPPVFATSRLIAWMEIAAARCLVPLLEPGELSVGVSVDIKHTAASEVGARLRIEARWVATEGKLFHFALIAYDEAGEIGSGTHTRAIVQSSRLVERAVQRRGGRS
jgi:predicted thioesterase